MPALAKDLGSRGDRYRLRRGIPGDPGPPGGWKIGRLGAAEGPVSA